MKAGIHPQYIPAIVVCACGNQFETRATQPELRVEICSNCHPFFTGRHKLMDTEGRVERFKQKYARYAEQQEAKPKGKRKAGEGVTGSA
jgi:large subunit ribosomal protein L31